MAEIVLLGVIVAVVIYELTDITPGGIVVPGLLVLYISQPVKILYTVVVALLTSLVVRLLSKRLLVYGKRRFVLLLLVGFLLHILFNGLLGLFIQSFSDVFFSLVGYTVVGILANNIYKQGAVRTVCATAVAVGVVEGIVLLLTVFGVFL